MAEPQRQIEAANGQALKLPAVTLRNLAQRLTPNPAFTVHGTLQMILDGVEKIDNEALARAVCHMTDRLHGQDTGPMTDEQWMAEDPRIREQLLLHVSIFKRALRAMTEEDSS